MDQYHDTTFNRRDRSFDFGVVAQFIQSLGRERSSDRSSGIRDGLKTVPYR